MALPITVPRLGWNMEQGVFAGWLAEEGATVRAGQPLYTLESDKATEDVENFDEGILHIPADGPRKGDVLAVGTVIGFVLQPGEPLPTRTLSTAVQAPAEQAAPVTEAAAVEIPRRERPTSSPRARRSAASLGVDWQEATATGRSGRIRERDVRALAAGRAEPQSAPAGNSLRRLIAERMLTSHRSTAPVTLTTTIDATELVRFRQRCQEAKSGDLVPTYTDLFVRLTALALEKHPLLNSRWEDERVVASQEISIGIAVETDAGLMVPVVRDVSSLSLKELALRTRDLIERARQRRLSASEMQGGTFTVTSLGALGIDAFTPIINHPECAILGIGRIRSCPVVFEEQIVIRDQVTLSLTFDHRISDGAPAARFLQTLSAAVEDPRGVS
jgi:pyruvate dehydrogenase E2 component (dihydrolipoamide acetyltransferase)